MAITSRSTRLARFTVTGRTVELRAYPEHGAWYEKRGALGEFYAPMTADGGFDNDEVGEIEEVYPRSACTDRFCNAMHDDEEGAYR